MLTAAPIPYVWPSLIALADTAKTTSWIQVAMAGGPWWSRRYGKFSITADDLRQMLHNFTTVTPVSPTQLPVDYDHLSMDPQKPGDGKAAGWFVTGQMELRENDTELWAEVAWTPEGAEAIKSGAYRFVSPSFIRDYVWKNGKNIGTTLIAAAITNHPFLEGMNAVTLVSDKLWDLAVAIDDRVDLALGYEGTRNRLATALRASGGTMSMSVDGPYIRDCDNAHVVYEFGGKAYRRAYAIDAAGQVTFGETAQEVVIQWAPLSAALNEETAMSDVFTLRDVRGTEVEVKAEALQQFIADQVAAAKSEAAKTAVPDGHTVISASKLAEFEQTGAKVVELNEQVTSLTSENEKVRKDLHLSVVTRKLDTLSQAGRITRPQREWALKAFGEPTSLAAFDDWVATVPTSPLVPVNREHGSDADVEQPAGKAASELNALALARAREKNISLAQAAREVAEERADLSERYRDDVQEAAPPRTREIIRH